MAKTLSNLNDLKSRTNRTLNSTDRYEYSAIFLKARMQFKLVSNIHTLMQIVEQMGLATSLESLNVDVYCLYDIHIFDSNEVLQIGSLSVFCVQLSEDAEASLFRFAGVGIALSARAEAALINCITINSQLCAVRLKSSIKV